MTDTVLWSIAGGILAWYVAGSYFQAYRRRKALVTRRQQDPEKKP